MVGLKVYRYQVGIPRCPHKWAKFWWSGEVFGKWGTRKEILGYLSGFFTTARFKQCPYADRSIQDEQLCETLSGTHGLPCQSIGESDSDALTSVVEKIVVISDEVDVEMKYLWTAYS